jgi:hypothetical protein
MVWYGKEQNGMKREREYGKAVNKGERKGKKDMVWQ